LPTQSATRNGSMLAICAGYRGRPVIMGKIRSPEPVKLFIGVLTSLPESLGRIEERLGELAGSVDLRSSSFPFEFTQYYDREMGSPIIRSFLGFADLIDAGAIAGIKLKTNALEAALASEFTSAARPVNLDPGYLEQAKIVLASTKNYYHRIYLSGGIYAEVTLHFEGGGWRAFPWTFPDFRSGRYDAFFAALRNRYRLQLKA
jgi:hypothetical protein